MQPALHACARLTPVLVSLQTVVLAPVEVGFLPSPDNALEPLFLLHRGVDLVFIIDVFVCFFIMFKQNSEGHVSFRRA
jgi:hypothetical protein